MTRVCISPIHPLITLLLCLMGTVGCGGPQTDRLPISGEVMLDAQPLNKASIQFTSAPGSAASAGGAVIIDGKYNIPAEHGLLPGTYDVRIFAPLPSKKDPNAPGILGLLPPEERVPMKYNVQTELKAEVARDRDNRFNFELESSSP